MKMERRIGDIIMRIWNWIFDKPKIACRCCGSIRTVKVTDKNYMCRECNIFFKVELGEK